MKKAAGTLLFLILMVCQSMAQNLPPELIRYADSVFYNGKILTADKDTADFTVADAIAVRDGRILYVGKSADAQRYAGPTTIKIDLKGKTMIPGIIASDGDNAFAAGDLYKYVQIGTRLIAGGRSL